MSQPQPSSPTLRNNRRALRLTLVLGLYFMLTYLTFLSYANILTYIGQHQQGIYSWTPLVGLASNYSIYLLTLIFSPMITRYKLMFQISAIAHLINYACYIPDFKGDLGVVMAIIGNIFGGYGAAIYWVSQGGYMMRMFRICRVGQNQEGKYFGIVNGIVYCSSLLGAVVTTFGLGYFGAQVYFSILTVLALVSWAVCTFFLDSLQGPANKKPSIIVDSFASSISSASQPTSPLLRSQSPPQKISPALLYSIFLNTIKYYPKMYYLLLIMVFNGIISGFISTYLSKLLPQSIRTDLNVGYMLMIEGVGCILGAISSAFSSDKFKVINVGRVGIGILFLTGLLTYINSWLQSSQQPTVYFPYFVAFWWGYLINYITSWQSVCCAKLNQGSLQSFSIVKQMQAISFIGFTIAMVITDNQINLNVFLGVMAGLAIATLVVFQVYQRREKEERDLYRRHK